MMTNVRSISRSSKERSRLITHSNTFSGFAGLPSFLVTHDQLTDMRKIMRSAPADSYIPHGGGTYASNSAFGNGSVALGNLR